MQSMKKNLTLVNNINKGQNKKRKTEIGQKIYTRMTTRQQIHGFSLHRK